MARRIEQSRWNRYGKLPSEQNPTNGKGLTYKQWLLSARFKNGQGTMGTYQAWLKGVDPLSVKVG